MQHCIVIPIRTSFALNFSQRSNCSESGHPQLVRRNGNIKRALSFIARVVGPSGYGHLPDAGQLDSWTIGAHSSSRLERLFVVVWKDVRESFCRVQIVLRACARSHANAKVPATFWSIAQVAMLQLRFLISLFFLSILTISTILVRDVRRLILDEGKL